MVAEVLLAAGSAVVPLDVACIGASKPVEGRIFQLLPLVALDDTCWRRVVIGAAFNFAYGCKTEAFLVT